MKNKLSKSSLIELYLKRKLSVSAIAVRSRCSENKVNYWLKKYGIKKRSIGEAIYIKHNPKGDPFSCIPPRNIDEAILYGLGLGLYWGEGNKANKNIVKIGNSDPELLKKFIDFLVKFFKINRNSLRFHLHLFSDIDLNKAVDFWKKELGFKSYQLYKPHITITGKLGTYKKKSQYGVMTVYFANTKLRNIIIALLRKPL